MHHLVGNILAAAAAWLLLQSFAFAQDVLKLAAGQRGSWETGISELGKIAGIFKKHGLDLELVYTAGSGETQQAVISGSVDIGIAVGSFGALGAYSKGAPIRAIGATMTGANDLLWYVRADSPIKSMRDTAGKQVSYSTNGSSTHLSVLAFRKHYDVDLKPAATGSPPGTFTQVMSGQIDVGWVVVPFGVQAADEGKIRFIATAGDLPGFKDQTIRVILTNLDAIKNKKPLLLRYLQAYRETVDWMYSDPSALKVYAQFAGLPESVAKRVRDDLVPKADLDPDRLSGLDGLMADAVTFKHLAVPLSNEQLSELFPIPFK
jgi:ABC-type nitrate/sulfonate/bicarbonate transport system substrate-binding protein